MADDGIVVFKTTAMLSPSIKELGSRLHLNIVIDYLNTISCSTASLDATSSDP